MAKRFFISAFIVLCLLSAGAAARQKTGTLKGRIEDSKGKPLAGAEVRVMRHRDRSVKETTTDQSGGYSFELEPDDYTVSFDAEGYQGGTMVQMQQVEDGKETTVKTIRLEKAKRTSLVRGAVFDASGLSLAGARVKLQRIPTEEEAKESKKIESLTRDYTTNSRGEFAFRLPAVRARYQLTAMLSGYKSETKVVDVHGSEAVPVAFSLEPIKK
ncbi:MAG TPA: carboxypeptidase-like regulatory domain-containing protein [Blastocatellia bacterium]|nr:carboxypeptidase-like regulatory domain-containing protein [Blastocatellia bacterium]